MLKFVAAGALALAVASTSFLYAQHATFVGVLQGNDPDEAQLWQADSADLLFDEGRFAALKSALMLSPDQERHWTAFERALRDFHKLRTDHRMAARITVPGNDPVQRLHQRATAMVETGAALEKLAEAAGPIYSSLDESQKREFAMLGRFYGIGHDRSRSREDIGPAKQARDRTEGEPAETGRLHVQGY